MISRDKLIDEKSQTLLIAMIYVEIYTRIHEKFDEETAAQKLMEFGNKIARSYYEYYKPSKSTVSGITRELSREIGGMKNVKIRRTEDGFTVSSPDCPLCVPELEIEGPAYCYPTCGILEEYLNLIFRDNPEKYPYKAVVGTVLKSQSCGAKVCEYYYKLVLR